MAVEDIRIYKGFFRSRKVRRLRREFGSDGIVFLIKLWIDAAEHRPKGDLTGYTVEDIADAAEFDGDAKFFVGTLVDLKFLDHNGDGSFSLHNWRNRQPWVFFSEERSENARRAVSARWEKYKKKPKPEPKKRPKKKAKKNQAVNTDRNAGRNTERFCPLPLPTPSGKGRDNAKDAESFKDSSTFASGKFRVFTGPESMKSILAKNGIEKE